MRMLFVCSLLVGLLACQHHYPRYPKGTKFDSYCESYGNWATKLAATNCHWFVVGSDGVRTDVWTGRRYLKNGDLFVEVK